MLYLRYNTAQVITVGPFLDATDAKTPEVALTATNEKLTLVVNVFNGTTTTPTLVLDTTLTGSSGNNDFVHITNDDAGLYTLELTAANTNYRGTGILCVTYATDHLPVFHPFTILPQQVFDSMIYTDLLQVDIASVNNTTDGVAEFSANIKSQELLTVTETNFSATATEFETESVSEPTAGHFVDRLLEWQTGNLAGKICRINAYTFEGGTWGHFTMTDRGEAPTTGDIALLI